MPNSEKLIFALSCTDMPDGDRVYLVVYNEALDFEKGPSQLAAAIYKLLLGNPHLLEPMSIAVNLSAEKLSEPLKNILK